METVFASFHFLRPFWLLAMLPAGVIAFALWHRQTSASNWRKVIDLSLLNQLLDNNQNRRRRLPVILLLIAWLLACAGLAGPVWSKLPQPVRKKEDVLVVIQDLSLSMYATDLAPDRLTRSRHKLLDLMNGRTEGSTALIVYSGDAHIVSPLTTDTKTIAAMIPALSPAIMPGYGSNVVEAAALALNFFRDTAAASGRILLITDEVSEKDGREITAMLRNSDISLSVIGAGTEDGSPIPTGDGFLKDGSGNIIVPRLNGAMLKKLAADNNGRYSDILLTDEDIDYVLAVGTAIGKGSYREVERHFDQWLEQGPWLVLLILPIALLAFRRGWIFVLVFVLVFAGRDAEAMTWNDLWLRKDQQAARVLNDGDPRQAAQLFQSRPWQGTAAYRAGEYADAADAFAASSDADSHYNRGNSLARTGAFQEAIEAYDMALKLDPGMKDARFNRKLVQEMLQQQQQQESDQNQEGQKSEEQDSAAGQGNDGDSEQDSAAGQGNDGDSEKESAADKNNSQQEHDTARNTLNKDKPAEDEQQQTGDQARKQQQADDEAQQQSFPPTAEQAPDTAGESSATMAPEQETGLSDEQRQSLQQWLRQIPDDPGGLLRRKFQYQYQTRKNQEQDSNKGKIW